MTIFKSVEDVVEWLEPMEWEEFWETIHALSIPPLNTKENCEAQIARGEVTADLILECSKGHVRMEMTRILKLQHRSVLEPIEISLH